MADVPQLKEAFQAGADIHAITAEELFGTVDRDTRAKAKTVNFAILYGISSWGLAGRLGVSKDEGKAIIDRYFERFPGIRAYIHGTLGFAREHGFTMTLFGRKTHFEPNIRSPNPSIRGGAERAAINAPIQGTSADLIKRAMARMDGALADAGLASVKMLLQVHDELVFEVPDGREAAAAAVIKQVMANAAGPAAFAITCLITAAAAASRPSGTSNTSSSWTWSSIFTLARPASASAPSIRAIARLMRSALVPWIGALIAARSAPPRMDGLGERIFGSKCVFRPNKVMVKPCSRAKPSVPWI